MKPAFIIVGRRRIALPAAEIQARGWNAGNSWPLGGIGRQYFAAWDDRHRLIKETSMSVIANLGSSVAAALPPINAHLHGHKKGSHVQSADDTSGSSDGTAQVPAGLQQNLFGSLLSSLEQVIGVQATTPATAPTGATSAAPTGTTSAAATGTTTAAAGTSNAAQSALTSLQNYLNNLLNNARTDGSPAEKLAGSILNVTA
jgi:hypothetical protein